MPNYCSILINVYFENNIELKRFKKFINENINPTIDVFEVNSSYLLQPEVMERHPKELEIFGSVPHAFSADELYAFFGVIKDFKFKKCSIRFAERGCDFIGKHIIEKNNKIMNELIEILDKKLHNNDKNIIKNILEYREYTYDIKDFVFYKDGIQGELEAKNHKDGMFSMEEYFRQAEAWFQEKNLDDYYFLWATSG